MRRTAWSPARCWWAEWRCTTGGDCLGDCRVVDVAAAPAAGTTADGQCKADSSRFGCYTTVENAKAEATMKTVRENIGLLDH